MTHIQVRIAGSTFHVTPMPILVACALLCAALIMGSFVRTLQASVQRGDTLREAQRAGTLAPPQRLAVTSHP